jgi:hypothetical protein
MCVFMAAIRNAYKKGENEFKSQGRDLLRFDTESKKADDTGVTILTREEILGK